MSRYQVSINERKDPSGWWIVLGAAVFIAFWKVLLFFIIAGSITWFLLRIQQDHAAKKKVREAELSMDADWQHMMALRGDPAGTYGNYDAYTMPLTKTMYTEYDDGLRNWK